MRTLLLTIGGVATLAAAATSPAFASPTPEQAAAMTLEPPVAGASQASPAIIPTGPSDPLMSANGLAQRRTVQQDELQSR